MRRPISRTGRAVAAGGLFWLCLVLSGWPAAAGQIDPTGTLALAQAQAQTPPAQPPNIESDITELHQRLRITPAQEQRFAAVAEIMRQNARAAAQMAPPANANAIEALRLAIQFGQQELDGMKRLLPALQALYATLTPAQQKTADTMFRQGPGE